MAEYFLCPKCNRNIPTINRILHEINCREVVKPALAEVADNEIPLAHAEFQESLREEHAQSSWACQVCTYINVNMDNSTCEVCGSHRYTTNDSDDVIEAQAVHINEVPYVNEDDVPGERNHLLSETDTRIWKCSTCTFNNDNSADICGMCSNVRPPQESRRERLISEDQFSPFDMHFSGFPAASESSSAGNNRTHPFTPALYGAGIGATLAWLNGRSVTHGALEGAGLGLAGGLVMQAMNQSSQNFDDETSQHHIVFSNRDFLDPVSSQSLERSFSSTLYEPGLSMALRREEMLRSMFGDMDEFRAGRDRQVLSSLEDMIRQLQGGESGASEDAISDLPVHKYEKSTGSSGNNAEIVPCSICLDHFKEGDDVKTLPCLHMFHADCVNRWLHQNRKCPVCKFSI